MIPVRPRALRIKPRRLETCTAKEPALLRIIHKPAMREATWHCTCGTVCVVNERDMFSADSNSEAFWNAHVRATAERWRTAFTVNHARRARLTRHAA